LTHPETLTVADVSFPLPSGWAGIPKIWEIDSVNSKTILRLSNTLLTKVTIASISIYQSAASGTLQDEDLLRWKEDAPKAYEARGYRVIELREFSSPAKIVCLELNREVEMFEVNCVFGIKRLRVAYYGKNSEIRDLYNFVTSAQSPDVESR
jgi:hypothetical protein